MQLGLLAVKSRRSRLKGGVEVFVGIGSACERQKPASADSIRHDQASLLGRCFLPLGLGLEGAPRPSSVPSALAPPSDGSVGRGDSYYYFSNTVKPAIMDGSNKRLKSSTGAPISTAPVGAATLPAYQPPSTALQRANRYVAAHSLQLSRLGLRRVGRIRYTCGSKRALGGMAAGRKSEAGWGSTRIPILPKPTGARHQ